MFGEEFRDVPIVQVSIDGSLSPEKNWAVGTVVEQLRSVALFVHQGDQLFDCYLVILKTRWHPRLVWRFGGTQLT